MNHFEFCLQIHKFTGMKRRRIDESVVGYKDGQGFLRKGRLWILSVSNGERVKELEWVQ